MAKLNKKYNPAKILRRIRRRNNKRRITYVPWFKRKTELNLNDLPSGVVTKIFSYIPLEDLFLSVRLVCKQWYSLAASASLWNTIVVGPDVPIELLLGWLENAPKLKTLRIQNRIDAGEILTKVHKYNKNIENINIHDCWGNERRVNLPSAPLCNVLMQCPYLDSISLRGSRFISCKFFRLLASRESLLSKRKRNIDHQRRSKKIQYYGQALKKQLQVFLKSRLECNRNKLALLTVEANPMDGTSNITVRQEITVNNEDDIQRILDSLNFE